MMDASQRDSGEGDVTLVTISSLDQTPRNVKREGHLFDDGRITYFMQHLDEIDPVIVFQDDHGSKTLADGYHRVEAAGRLGRTSIRAVFRQGSRSEALS